MWKAVLVGTASLMLAGSSLVYAQQQSGAPAAAKPAAAAPAPATAQQQALVMAEEMAAFHAAHMAALKAGLKLTPDQEKNWAPLEKALDELNKEQAGHAGEQPEAAPPSAPENEDPVTELQKRADEMFKEASALKHLADAVGPLFASLDESQKHRFHMLAPPLLSYHLHGEQNQQANGGAPGEMGQPGAGGEQMGGAPPQQGGYGAPMQSAYGGPMAGAPPQGGYGGPMMGAPSQQGGYGGPMAGAPPQQGGYGGPMMGAPSQQGGYGGPMGAPLHPGAYGGGPTGAPPQQGGYGGPMMGAPSQQGGYGGPMGAPPQQGGYGGPMGAPPQQGAYGGPMGAPPQHDGYGGPMMGGNAPWHPDQQAAQHEYGPEHEQAPGAQAGMSPYGGAPYGQNGAPGYEHYQQQGQGPEEAIDE